MHIFSSSTFFSRFLFCCFLLFSSFSFSQEKDSLSQYSYEELTEKFQKVHFQDTNVARIYAIKALHIAKKENDFDRQVKTYINLASIENKNGSVEKSLLYIDNATDIARQKLLDKDLEAECIFTKARIYHSAGAYEKAILLYTDSYNYYKNTNDRIKTNATSLNIALIKNILGDPEGAIKILLKNYNVYTNASEETRRKEYSKMFYINTLLGLTDAYSIRASDTPENSSVLLDSAAIFNDLGLEKARQIDDVEGTIFFTAEKGIILLEQNRYKEAMKYLDESLEINESFQQPSLLSSIYYYKGICHKQLNQIDKAIHYLKKTDSITKKTSMDYVILQNSYHALAKIYIDRKDFANSTKYLQLHIQNDLINDQVTETVRKEIREKHDIGILQEEIDKLNYEIEKKSLKTTTIIVLLMSLLLGFFIFYRYQKRKNKVAFEKIVKQLDAKKNLEITPEKIKPALPITIDDEKVVAVLKALEKFEEKEWFRNKNCDLAFVAKKAKTNKTYLSKIIHTHKQLKFIDYIRNLRIDYALERLKDDPVFRSYDIKSIAEESGFKSSDMFSRAFVKNTGIYPSYYIKNINKINT